MQQNLKEKTLKICDVLYNQHDGQKLKDYLPEDFIQHNPMVESGKEAMLNILSLLKEIGLNYKNIRLFQDGNYVIMHNAFDNSIPFGAK